MRPRFDDRLEKRIFFFVIALHLILLPLMLIARDLLITWGIMVGREEVDFSVISLLVFTIIPLLMAYAIPWKEEEKDIKFDRREAKITCIYLGVLFLWHLLAKQLKILYPMVIPATPVLPAIPFHPLHALYWFGFLFLVFLFVMIRKQSLKTIGITTRNLGRSMILVIIPFVYLLYIIFTFSFSPALVMRVAFHCLEVGIIGEFLFRGFPLFRLEALGKGKAVLITGVLFAAVHGLSAFPLALLFGLSYGLIFSKTRNILPLILIHMITDIVGNMIPYAVGVL